jgi:hypothetical protein
MKIRSLSHDTLTEKAFNVDVLENGSLIFIKLRTPGVSHVQDYISFGRK